MMSRKKVICCAMFFFALNIMGGGGGGVFAFGKRDINTLESAADKLLTQDQDNIRKVEGRNVAIVTANDAISVEFGEVFQNKIKQYATVVMADFSITKKELERQESGLVDEKEIASLGKQKGAQIVIQLLLSRIPGEKKVKIQMLGLNVEGSYLELSGVVETQFPARYDIKALPLQTGLKESDIIKKEALKIINENVSGIYNEPPPEPKPSKPPKKSFVMPELPLTFVYGIDLSTALSSLNTEALGWEIITAQPFIGIMPEFLPLRLSAFAGAGLGQTFVLNFGANLDFLIHEWLVLGIGMGRETAITSELNTSCLFIRAAAGFYDAYNMWYGKIYYDHNIENPGIELGFLIGINFEL